MRHATVLNEHAREESVFDLLHRALPDFVLRSTVLNTADYGVPQSRRRLITLGIRRPFTEAQRSESYDVFSASPSCLHAPPTHGPASAHEETRPHVTLRDCLQHLAALDGRDKTRDNVDAYHRVPKWNDMQYFCMQHTPEGATAFDNASCAHCGHDALDARAILCERCGHRLPRPCVRDKDRTWRLIRAFKTSYRRMRWDKPANALTTNSGVISSDVKGHPEQNRVLSLREIMIVASLEGYPGCEQSFEYAFGDADDKLIREVLGECIPPLFAYKLARHLIACAKV
jgi:DNA (cytosine-5)-methyltransferase 1